LLEKHFVNIVWQECNDLITEFYQLYIRLLTLQICNLLVITEAIFNNGNLNIIFKYIYSQIYQIIKLNLVCKLWTTSTLYTHKLLARFHFYKLLYYFEKLGVILVYQYFGGVQNWYRWFSKTFHWWKIYAISK